MTAPQPTAQLVARQKPRSDALSLPYVVSFGGYGMEGRPHLVPHSGATW